MCRFDPVQRHNPRETSGRCLDGGELARIPNGRMLSLDLGAECQGQDGPPRLVSLSYICHFVCHVFIQSFVHLISIY